jgi:hypothetical protein
MEVSGHLHSQAVLLWEKATSAQWIEGWVGFRAGLDTVDKRNITYL